MRIRERLWVGLLAMVLAVTAVESAIAQTTSPPDRTRRFELGTDIGFAGGTLDGTAFAVGIYGDFPVIPYVTIGPLMQLGVTDDLFQIGISAQAKLTIDIPDVPELKPQIQAGIGFIHADLDFGNASDDDTSWLIPIGFGLEYRAMRNLYFTSTLLFNLTDLEIANESDNLHVSWYVGLRFLL